MQNIPVAPSVSTRSFREMCKEVEDLRNQWRRELRKHNAFIHRVTREDGWTKYCAEAPTNHQAVRDEPSAESSDESLD